MFGGFHSIELNFNFAGKKGITMKNLRITPVLFALMCVVFAPLGLFAQSQGTSENDRILSELNAPQCRVTMNQEGVSLAARENVNNKVVVTVNDQNGIRVYNDSINVYRAEGFQDPSGQVFFGRVLFDVVSLSSNRFAIMYSTSDPLGIKVFLRMRVYRYTGNPGNTTQIGDYLLDSSLLSFFMYHIRCEADDNSIAVAFCTQFDSTSNYRLYNLPLNSSPSLISSVNLPYFGTADFVAVDINRTTDELFILHTSRDTLASVGNKKLRILRYSNLNASTLVSTTLISHHVWSNSIPGIAVNRSGQVSVSFYEHDFLNGLNAIVLRNQVHATTSNSISILDDSYLAGFYIGTPNGNNTYNKFGVYGLDVALNDRINQTIFDQKFIGFTSYADSGSIDGKSGLFIYTLNIGTPNLARIDALDTGINVLVNNTPGQVRTKVSYNDIANSGYGCQLFTGAWIYQGENGTIPFFHKVLPNSRPEVLINGSKDSIFCFNDTIVASLIFDTLLIVNSYTWVYDTTKLRAITTLNNDTVILSQQQVLQL